MNKFLIVAIAFAVVAVSAQGPGGPMSEELKKFVEECKAETGASMDDIKAIISMQGVSEKTWCFIGCMNKKSGAMGPDNKLNMDKVQQGMAPIKESKPEMYSKLMAAMQECKVPVESNAANLATQCTAAKAMGECVKSKM